MGISYRHSMPKQKRPYPSLITWQRETFAKQCDAARFLGVSQPYYSKVARGLMAPSPRKAKLISEQTGVPLESLLGLV